MANSTVEGGRLPLNTKPSYSRKTVTSDQILIRQTKLSLKLMLNPYPEIVRQV